MSENIDKLKRVMKGIYLLTEADIAADINNRIINVMNDFQSEIKELKRQRDLYKKSNDFYANAYTSWEDENRIISQDIGWLEDEYSNYRKGGKFARQIEKEVQGGE